MSKVRVVQGDITKQRVDAVVNAANRAMRGGGGVDGAIHRAGGPTVLQDCIARFPQGLAIGDAGWTTAGRLPARRVIHTVGPNHRAGQTDRSLLESCYRRSLAVADEIGARSIAFPLISAGVYGWPKDDAIDAALTTVWSTDTDVESVLFVAFDGDTYDRLRAAQGSDTPRRILEGVAALHARGFEQIRVLPGVAPSGMFWRASITDGETDGEEGGEDEGVQRYTTGNGPDFADAAVDRSTTAAEVADLILGALPRAGGPRPDPVYAAWYARLMRLVAQHDRLPVAYSDSYVQEPGWEIGWGSGIRIEEPPPRG
jgi:O-acetyl-ADP-ribose deacetylase (regulator of RNase III)